MNSDDTVNRHYPKPRSQRVRRWLRYLAFGFSATMAAAVAFLLYADTVGNDEFRKICEEQAGVKIYKKVTARGYFDNGAGCLYANCWGSLLDSDFDFVESFDGPKNPQEEIESRGYLRFSKVSLDDELCSDRFLESVRQSSHYRDLYGDTGVCVSIAEIKEPSAKYEYYWSSLPRIELNNWAHSVVTLSKYQIRDRFTLDPIVVRIVPALLRNSLPSLSSFQTAVSCEHVGVVDNAPPLNSPDNYIGPEALSGG